MQEAPCFGTIVKVHSPVLMSGACFRPALDICRVSSHRLPWQPRHSPRPSTFVPRGLPPVADHEGGVGKTPVPSPLLPALLLARGVRGHWLHLPVSGLRWLAWQPPPPRPAVCWVLRAVAGLAASPLHATVHQAICKGQGLLGAVEEMRHCLPLGQCEWEHCKKSELVNF